MSDSCIDYAFIFKWSTCCVLGILPTVGGDFFRFFQFLRNFGALSINCVFLISTKALWNSNQLLVWKKKILVQFLFVEKRCQQLYAPPHGSLEPCSNLPGQTCEFSCNKGYILMGSRKRTCNSDGTWTGTPTQCKGDWPQLLLFSLLFNWIGYLCCNWI